MLLRRKIKIILLLFCATGFNNLLHSQTTYIFEDDSLKKKLLFGNHNEVFANQPYRSVHPFGFKEKLPDGEYIYIALDRKDSTKKDLKDYIYLKGQYTDSLRQGKFEYYNRFKIKNKYVNKLMTVYTYKNGLLDGYYMLSNTAYKAEEGYYKAGKQDGFFIEYDYYGGGSVQEIEYYKEDTLMYRVKYKEGEMQPVEIKPRVEKFKIPEGHNIPLRSPVKKDE